MDANCSLREGGQGHPLREGGCQCEGGKMPVQEREDAGHSLREGGCWPFIERGRSLFIERGRRLLFIVVGGRIMNFHLVGKFKVQ